MIGAQSLLMLSTPPVSVGATDPYYSSVVCLLHFNGTDGSTIITDQKGHSFSVAGDAKLSTTAPLIGTASLLLDGNGDYISSPDSADWDLPGDFTVELKGNASSLNVSGSTDPCLIATYPNGPVGVNIVMALSVASAGDPTSPRKPYLYWYDGGNHFLNSSAAITIGSNFDLSLVRIGTTLSLYLAGNQVGTGTMSGTVNASGLIIGAVNSTSGFWNGKIDEVRITKGVGRYTGNYTPSTLPFPNS